jgi:peptidyl-prolyl cis-trans isomerase A (cyclophilin A)
MYRGNVLLIVLMVSIQFGCKTRKQGDPVVEIETKYGNVEVELYASKAPKTVAAFLANVDKGLYKGASFYRVLNEDNQPSNAMKSKLVQGGIYKSNRSKDGIPLIPHETTRQTGITHTNGVISMARLEPGTASTEFFICLGDQHGFDYGGANNEDGQGYAAFGKVIKGMEIVHKIYNQNESDQSFDPPIHIFNISRL